MTDLWSELSGLEQHIGAEVAALGEAVGPLEELVARQGRVQQQLEALEELLRKASVGAAAAPSLAESAKAALRLEGHWEQRRRLQADLLALRPLLRRNAERHAAQERDLLLRRRKGDTGQTLAKKSALRTAERGTTSLREANAMMMREVQRMQAARSEVDDVSGLMRDAAAQHKDLEGHLGIGRGLVTRLERREWTDRMLIGFATAVFFLIVLYILQQRLWGSSKPIH